MQSFLTVFLTLSLVFMISCATRGLKQNEIGPWLNTVSGGQPPKIDISGKWHDANGNFMVGWGEGYLHQEQNTISGSIGSYNIKGVVSGKTAYLVFLSGGAVYYTARLELFEDGILNGNYFYANDKDQINGYPTLLERISGQATVTPPSYAVIGVFDDHNEVFRGHIYEKSNTVESVLELQGQLTGMKCYGSSIATKVPNNTVDCKGLEGDANVSCDDGRVIAGKWKAVECRKGVAQGVDQNGNQLSFVYGMTDVEAQMYIERLVILTSNLPPVPPVYRPKETRKEKGFSTGTGFFVTANGHIITNYHVIDGSDQLFVITKNGTKMRARYLKGDPSNDVAILKVDYASKPLPVLKENRLSVGDDVFTLGYPLIERQGQEQKVTFGHINALSGFTSKDRNDINGDIRFIQIDVPVQPGNSGGPLLNDSGQVSGVVTATLDELSTMKDHGHLPQNVNYAVKSDYLVPLIRTQLGESWNSAPISTNRIAKADVIKNTMDSVVLIVAMGEDNQQVNDIPQSTPLNPDSANATLKEKAEKGDAKAQVSLAALYYAGDGVPQDYKLAINWLRKAAEQGDAGAQLGLGVMYAKGEGVPQNDINAYAWHSLAAAQGQEGAAKLRDEVASKLSPEQRIKAQALAAELQAKIDSMKK